MPFLAERVLCQNYLLKASASLQLSPNGFNLLSSKWPSRNSAFWFGNFSYGTTFQLAASSLLCHTVILQSCAHLNVTCLRPGVLLVSCAAHSVLFLGSSATSEVPGLFDRLPLHSVNGRSSSSFAAVKRMRSRRAYVVRSFVACCEYLLHNKTDPDLSLLIFSSSVVTHALQRGLQVVGVLLFSVTDRFFSNDRRKLSFRSQCLKM